MVAGTWVAAVAVVAALYNRSILAALARCRSGATATIIALMMPLLVGTTGLVTEYGYGMLRKAETQRVADVAAFSGAVAYNTALDNSATASQSATAMTSAALGLAAINAVSASNVVVSLVDSPTLAATRQSASRSRTRCR